MTSFPLHDDVMQVPTPEEVREAVREELKDEKESR
jgi:hypothetical protein